MLEDGAAKFFRRIAPEVFDETDLEHLIAVGYSNGGRQGRSCGFADDVAARRRSSMDLGK